MEYEYSFLGDGRNGEASQKCHHEYDKKGKKEYKTEKERIAVFSSQKPSCWLQLNISSWLKQEE